MSGGNEDGSATGGGGGGGNGGAGPPPGTAASGATNASQAAEVPEGGMSVPYKDAPGKMSGTSNNDWTVTKPPTNVNDMWNDARRRTSAADPEKVSLSYNSLF